MKTINFKHWKLFVDEKLTNETYKKVEVGGVESCECNDCKNFAKNRENIYPEEIKNLLIDLGIDYHKECEVWHYCKDEFGKHCYSGWFHFKGKFEGENCKVDLQNNISTYNLTPITENFSIGFLNESSLTFFEEKQNLVQVEFDVKTEWTISKDLEME
jgi:hypothetical protein